MSEKKKESKLSLSAKADKFDVPLSTLKKVYKRGVAAWNSGHRPGTTPQQWGHARVNSFLRKGKTYHTADKDLREDAEQLNELDIQTYNKYIEATYSQTPAAQARKLGGPKHAQRTLGRLRARTLKQKQINKPEHQAKLAQIRAEHEALHNPNKDPSGRGYGEGRYMGDHVEHDPDINKLFEDQMNEGIRQLFSLDPQKDQSFAQTAVETGLSFIPGVGQALAARDIERARRAGDRAGMAAAAASMIPGGRLVNVAGKARKIFVPASKEAQDALKAMERAGKSREEIWSATRTLPGGSAFRNPQTGEIRQEISDAGMRLRRPLAPQAQVGQASQVIQHDDLFKQFPDIGKFQTKVEQLPKGYRNVDAQGMFQPGRVPGQGAIWTRRSDEAGALDTLTHELQHAVQHRTGAKSFGTSPKHERKYVGLLDRLTGKTEKVAMQRHFENPGEIEAGAATARRTLTPAQRQERYPWLDYTVPGQKPTVAPKPVATSKPMPAPATKPVATSKPMPAPAPLPLPSRARGSGYTTTPVTPPRPVKLTAESVEDINEMQLVGTDEYRQHAIAMTPGQDQEIEDAFPPEVYGAQVYEPTPQEEPTNVESNGSTESGVDSTSGNSFRTIRKKLKEQQAEEYEEIEAEEEEELEDDGAEDGIDFTPTLKTKKLRNTGPFDAAKVDNSGLPVLSTSMFSEGNDVSVNESRQQQRNTVRPAQRPVAPAKPKTSLLSRITRGAGRAGAALTIAGAADKARSGDLRGAATDVGIEAGTNVLAKKAGKTIAKRIPLVGAGIGIASAVKRAKAGDLIGAAGEAASGVASTLPGAGTAVSTGIDAALMARDIAKKQKPNLAEAIEYHKENNISLVENIYRPGSEMFFEMIFEAKRQFAEGSYTPKDEYEQDLLESDIGEVAEYNGTPVLLDFPYEEIDEELDEACWDGYEQKGMKKKGKKMVPNCVPVSEENDPTRGKGIGKPFRSRGGGAVYVRNEKGNIIKVNFSQSGMKKRFNEPARVKSFVARHNCYGNKDRTSASYWACRWPRYFSDSGQQWW